MRKKFIKLPSAKEKAEQRLTNEAVEARVRTYFDGSRERFLENLKKSADFEASGVLAGPTK